MSAMSQSTNRHKRATQPSEEGALTPSAKRPRHESFTPPSRRLMPAPSTPASNPLTPGGTQQVTAAASPTPPPQYQFLPRPLSTAANPAGFINPAARRSRVQKMKWTAENDRKLLLFGLGKEIKSGEMQAVADSFPEKPTVKSIQERLTKLRKEQHKYLVEDGILPGKNVGEGGKKQEQVEASVPVAEQSQPEQEIAEEDHIYNQHQLRAYLARRRSEHDNNRLEMLSSVASTALEIEQRNDRGASGLYDPFQRRYSTPANYSTPDALAGMRALGYKENPITNQPWDPEPRRTSDGYETYYGRPRQGGPENYQVSREMYDARADAAAGAAGAGDDFGFEADAIERRKKREREELEKELRAGEKRFEEAEYIHLAD